MDHWLAAGEDQWRKRLEDVPLNLIAELDGRPAGMAGATAPEAGTTELISMWVAPFARGRGTGDALVRAVQEWAAEVGAHAVVLDVFETNVHAAALYRRNGFRGEGERLEYQTESGGGL